MFVKTQESCPKNLKIVEKIQNFSKLFKYLKIFKNFQKEYLMVIEGRGNFHFFFQKFKNFEKFQNFQKEYLMVKTNRGAWKFPIFFQKFKN